MPEPELDELCCPEPLLEELDCWLPVARRMARSAATTGAATAASGALPMPGPGRDASTKSREHEVPASGPRQLDLFDDGGVA